MSKKELINELIRSLAIDHWVLKREGKFDVKAYYHNRDKNVSIFPQGLFIYCVTIIERDDNLIAKKKHDKSVILYPNRGILLWVMLKALNIPDVKVIKEDRIVVDLIELLRKPVTKTP